MHSGGLTVEMPASPLCYFGALPGSCPDHCTRPVVMGLVLHVAISLTSYDAQGIAAGQGDSPPDYKPPAESGRDGAATGPLSLGRATRLNHHNGSCRSLSLSLEHCGTSLPGGCRVPAAVTPTMTGGGSCPSSIFKEPCPQISRCVDWGQVMW